MHQTLHQTLQVNDGDDGDGQGQEVHRNIRHEIRDWIARHRKSERLIVAQSAWNRYKWLLSLLISHRPQPQRQA
jgi:hypothetical protein